MDYFLSGDAMEPPDGANHYSERLIRLPGFGLAYEKFDIPSRPKTRADKEFGIPLETVVYVSLQSLFKYLPRHDYIFAEIARSVPHAKIVFIADADAWSVDRFRQRLRREFEKVRLDYTSHCLLLPRQVWLDYLSLYVCSDVCLVTLGWSGGNTSLEAIACGLPIVTLPGKFMRGRHTYAFLQLMGVTETVAETEQGYISIAIKLGLDARFRETIRDKIIGRRNRLYDDQACVRALEEFYCEVVKNLLFA